MKPTAIILAAMMAVSCASTRRTAIRTEQVRQADTTSTVRRTIVVASPSALPDIIASINATPGAVPLPDIVRNARQDTPSKATAPPAETPVMLVITEEETTKASSSSTSHEQQTSQRQTTRMLSPFLMALILIAAILAVRIRNNKS